MNKSKTLALTIPNVVLDRGRYSLKIFLKVYLKCASSERLTQCRARDKFTLRLGSVYNFANLSVHSREAGEL